MCVKLKLGKVHHTSLQNINQTNIFSKLNIHQPRTWNQANNMGNLARLTLLASFLMILTTQTTYCREHLDRHLQEQVIKWLFKNTISSIEAVFADKKFWSIQQLSKSYENSCSKYSWCHLMNSLQCRILVKLLPTQGWST